MRSTTIPILTCLACLGLTAPINGTTLLYLDLAELTRRADRVFVGTCESSEPRLIDGRIHTRFEFSVKETVKGSTDDRIVLHLPGGEYLDTRLDVAGMPGFFRGEEVVLFLTAEDRPSGAWPVGLTQGKFRIEYRGGAKVAHVVRRTDGVSLYARPPSAEARKIAPWDQRDGMPLSEFLGQIRDLAKESAGDRH